MRRLSAVEIADLVRATKELALARHRLAVMSPPELLAVAYDRGNRDADQAGPAASAYARRVGIAIGRMSSRVPWRASCLVQALAARRWLSHRGIESSLFVGVRRQAAQRVEAHAWLVCVDDVITGGDITGYRELLSPYVMASLKVDERVTSPRTP
jgi:hypothetical protein